MRRSTRARLKTALLAGAFAAAALAPGSARAQGFFDFLFGGPQQPAPQPPSYHYPAPPPPDVGRVAPVPLGQERISSGEGNTGHGVAFCVRLCDGQHFPMERMANATPVDTCRAICPHASTKVYYGSEIASAVGQDGQPYSSLPTAFVYRKQLVTNCTCNGKDALGLVSLDVKTDPTLRPGDIVSTGDGLLSYTGRSGQGGAFAPINPASLPVDIGSAPPGSVPLPSSSSDSSSNPQPSAQAQPAATAQQTNAPQTTAPATNTPQTKPHAPGAAPAANPRPRPPQ